MLRACPHHGFSELTQIDTFYNGLNEQNQDSLNAAAGGNLLNKTTRKALKIIENKSRVRYLRSKSNVSRVNTNSKDIVNKTDDRIDKLTDQISNLVEIVNKQVLTPASAKAVEKTCVTCGGAHAYYDCIATNGNQPSVCAVTGSYNQALKQDASYEERSLSAQSLAARARRRKISEKTQEFGKLIPGGQKMNTAEMFQVAFNYRLNPRYAIKECLSCGTLYTGDFCCSKGNVEDKILVLKLPKNCTRCARCGHPVNGPYCQGCTLLREKLEEDLVTYFQNFQNTSESSDDSTNVVNAPREPFIVKQDHGVNPPHIDECCCECGDALDGIYCQQCICKSCRKGAHIGYNCPPKVLIISNPEPCNQTMNNELPQTFPSFDSTCYSDKENSVHCISKPNFVDESSSIFNPHPQPPIYSCESGSNAQYGHYCTPQVPFINLEPGYSQDFNFPQDIHDFQQQYLYCDQYGGPHETFQCQQVLLLAWDRDFEIKDALGTKQYKLEDIQELFRQLLNDVQNIHEELAEYINTPGWNRPAFYDDDDVDDVDYTIAITPVLSTEDPDNYLSMGDKHLDTIPATKSDELIKSSVENLVLIPSEFEGIPDTMCDVHLANNPTPLEAKDHFEIFINSNDDISSSDDDYLYNENIEYVEASPHDSELVSLEATEIVIPEVEEIEDDNLREKLLNVHLLIANIKALKDNPTPSAKLLTKSSSTSPKSFLEETNTFHNSLPEFENLCFDLEEISISLPDYEFCYFDDDHIREISSGSTTTHSYVSLSEYDSFIFDLTNDQFPPTDRRILPVPGELMSILNSGIRENLSSTTYVNLPIEDDHSLLLAYVVWIFLAYLTYPVIPPYLHSFGNEDTIFDPGITINHFYSFKPGLSHRRGAFKKFNTHHSHLNEWPMIINGKNTPILDVLLFHFYPLDQLKYGGN
nr:Myc-type, basic helix-loop-helix (bHLH) domain-containing protein [Tanacetum cinerariifolium]